MNIQLYQLRDDLADIMDVAPKEAHEGAKRRLLNRFLIEAQRTLYWEYEFDALKRYWQLFTVAGVNLYAYPGTPGNWAANTNMVINQVIYDGTNYQSAGRTGQTGGAAPAWNAQLGGATVDNGVTWVNLGPTTPPTPDPRRFDDIKIIYNNGWLRMREGIPSVAYTLTSTMLPRRYAHRQGLFEVWPSPDTVYTIEMHGYQALNAFTKDTDSLTIDRDLVFYSAVAAAKANPKFNHPDAKLYADTAAGMLRNLRAKNFGNKRFIPGGDPDLPIRPIPLIVNPE